MTILGILERIISEKELSFELEYANYLAHVIYLGIYMIIYDGRIPPIP